MSRGLNILAAGVVLWILSRFTGSQGLHMVATGVILLPIVSAIAGRARTNVVRIERKSSSDKVMSGDTLSVELRAANESSVTSSFLLVEDRVPPQLGRPARLVLTGIPPANSQTASYELTTRARGRFVLGPTSVEITDPFGFTRRRIESDEREELLVTPHVESLLLTPTGSSSAGSGTSAFRHLHLGGRELFTIRGYQVGDDLRRIHWPSVARTGNLMIRQDEAPLRASAVLFLDARRSVLGLSGSPGFERAVSAAASIGVMLLDAGFSLRFAAPERPPSSFGKTDFIEMLAGIEPCVSRVAGIGSLATTMDPGASLAVITGLPDALEIAALSRVGKTYGSRFAVLVYPNDPVGLTPDARSNLEDLSANARLSLGRAGWQTVAIGPNDLLEDAWRRAQASTASSF